MKPFLHLHEALFSLNQRQSITNSIKKALALILFLCFFTGNNFSQAIIRPEQKMYVDSNQRIHINKAMPVYLRLATSPNDTSKGYLLHSEKTTAYSNPMYFDTEGKNTIRSPSEVDTSTKKVVHPLQDIIFEVYADGKPPITTMRITGAKKAIIKGKPFYGQGMKLELSAIDEVSDVENIFCSIDREAYKPYVSALTFTNEKEYEVKYYSVDKVGNLETPSSVGFSIDVTPPKTELEVQGSKKGNFLSRDAQVVLTSTDNLSGVKAIYYSVNNAPFKVYKTPVPLSIFRKEQSVMKYYAVDNLGNKEEVKTFGTSETVNSSSQNGEKGIFDFYIDDQPPVVKLNIEGDQFKAKYLFVSDRSKIKLEATDDKSGVDKIWYGIDAQAKANVYGQPFSLTKNGLQYINYSAIDFVENTTPNQTAIVYLDKTAPKSRIVFSGRKFLSRDTLFITKNTWIKIRINDNESGVKETKFNIDGNPFNIYTDSMKIETDGAHKISYYSLDNVNNQESEKSMTFYVDNTPPKIFAHFSVKCIGHKTVNDETYDVYPPNTVLYLGATDDGTGCETLNYTLNGGAIQNKLPIGIFNPGHYVIKIMATDVLKNKATTVIKFFIE